MRIPYVLNRILQTIPVILGIVILSFVLIQMAPGDPIAVFVGEGGASPQYVAELTRRFGLDRPVSEQLLLYLGNVLRGDLGNSIHQGAPVLTIIASRAMPTIILMGFSIALGSILGVIMGVYASIKPHSLRDNSLIVAALVFYSMPSFWLGQLLIIVFSVSLGVLPAAGMYSFATTSTHPWIGIATHLVLPVTTLGLGLAAFVMRFVRASMIEALGQDYILTAQSKGLAERTVFYKHALRNALLPVVTYIGLRVAHLTSGAVVIESVFGWPGLGRLLIDALFARDYPLIMGMFIIVSLSVTLVTLVVDMLYAYIDPRIKTQ